MQGPFFYGTPVNLINKSSEMLFQKLQQRYTRLINTIYFPVSLLTNHETTYNLKILCWASTHLLSQSLPFLQLQVCDLVDDWSKCIDNGEMIDALFIDFRKAFDFVVITSY